MQTSGAISSFSVAKELYAADGIKGLYRGGTSIAFGGALIRSTQFGVYKNSLSFLQNRFGTVQSSERILGVFDYQVVAAGFLGGIGRGLVEGPFEYIKVRRQVDLPWKFRELFQGSSATVFRNSFLFSSFVIYMDILKLIVPGGLGAFFTGAICSNLAWLTVWPIDVAKSQLQSGKYEGKSLSYLMRSVITSGLLFRGLVPGLSRSTIANGLSMMAYEKVEKFLQDKI